MPQTNGEIHHIAPTQQITDNFSKREFIVIIDQNTNHPQHIKFEFNNTHCALLDPLKPGDKVSVDYNLKGRLDTRPDKLNVCYNTLQAWKIQKV